jgi:hypothetical protein
MRESDSPPPGDPSLRRSGLWAGLIIGVFLVFVVWFVLEHHETREPGRPPTVPGVQNAGK